MKFLLELSVLLPKQKHQRKGKKKQQSFQGGQSIHATVSTTQKKEDLEILRNDKPENKSKKQNAIFTNIGYFSYQQGCLVIQIMYQRIKT